MDDLRYWNIPVGDLNRVYLEARAKFSTPKDRNELPIPNKRSIEQLQGLVDTQVKTHLENLTPKEKPMVTADGDSTQTATTAEGTDQKQKKSEKATVESTAMAKTDEEPIKKKVKKASTEHSNLSQSVDEEAIDTLSENSAFDQLNFPPTDSEVSQDEAEKINPTKPRRSLSLFEKRPLENWPREEEINSKRLHALRSHLVARSGDGIEVSSEILLPEHVSDAVTRVFRKKGVKNPELWRKTYEHRLLEVIDTLLEAFPERGVKRKLEEQVNAIPLKAHNPADASYAHTYAQKVSLAVYDDRHDSVYSVKAKESKTMLEHFKKSTLKTGPQPVCGRIKEKIFGSNKNGDLPKTLGELCDKVVDVANELAIICDEATKIGYVPASDQLNNKKRKFEGNYKAAVLTGDPSNCNACGRICKKDGCQPGSCKFWKTHPHVNRENSKSWAESKFGVIYAKMKCSTLPADKISKKQPDGSYKLVNLTAEDKKKKSDIKVSDIAATNIINYLSNQSTFNPFIHARLANNGKYFGKGLLDSGAFGGYINNYVSESIVAKLVATQAVATCDCLSTKVCTIVGCIQTSKCINFKVELYNDIGQIITIDTKARVVKGLPYDFIIGLTTIRKYQLARRCPSVDVRYVK